MFARTTRLTLRPGWPEDAPALAAAIGQEAVARRLSRVPLPYTLDDATGWLTREGGVTDHAFLVFDHAGGTPQLVGGIGLHPEEGEVEIGYWFVPDAWGRGYATEAGRAVVDMARHALGLPRIASRYHLDNPASGRVLRKLGFEATGEVRPTYSLAQGCEVPTALMQLDLKAMQLAPPIAA